MNIEKNQEFKTVGMISMFLVMGISILLLAPVWNSESEEAHSKALYRAEGLAYQILEGRKGSNRVPASASALNILAQESGAVGEDPWGGQYYFKMFSQLPNEQTKILVWSAGPNGKKETEDSIIESNRNTANPAFGGDDLGIVILVK